LRGSPKSSKYAQILKNSVAFKETANERIFLMKDLAAVEEAVGLGARIREAYLLNDGNRTLKNGKLKLNFRNRFS